MKSTSASTVGKKDNCQDKGGVEWADHDRGAARWMAVSSDEWMLRKMNCCQQGNVYRLNQGSDS